MYGASTPAPASRAQTSSSSSTKHSPAHDAGDDDADSDDDDGLYHDETQTVMVLRQEALRDAQGRFMCSREGCTASLKWSHGRNTVNNHIAEFPSALYRRMRCRTCSRSSYVYSGPVPKC